MSGNRWSEYSQRVRLTLATMFGGLFLIALAQYLISTSLEPIISVLIIAWAISVIIGSFRVAGFRCPRCGERFFAAGLYYNPYARKCIHCDLPKWHYEDEQA